MHLYRHLFQRLTVPLTRDRFWRYATWFWGGFAVLSYVQVTLWELLAQGDMHYTETIHWLIRWGLWLIPSPLMLLAADRYPIQFHRGWPTFSRQIGLHLLLITLLSALITVVEFVLVEPLYAWVDQGPIVPRDALVWFLTRYSTFVAIYMLVVAGYQGLVTTRHNQSLREQTLRMELDLEQVQARLDQAQLLALKMQLNPHFLFNTHHTIIGLIMNGEYKKAIQTLTALSTLFRTIVDQHEVQFVSLQQELDFIKSYLHIQQIRFQDRLSIQIELAPETVYQPVPQFILQPLVENAFVHGLEKVAGPVQLRITACHQEEQLLIQVQDNGAGMSKTSLGQGVGLRNTRQRLHQLYGEQARLVHQPTPGGGTIVAVTIPWTNQPCFTA